MQVMQSARQNVLAFCEPIKIRCDAVAAAAAIKNKALGAFILRQLTSFFVGIGREFNVTARDDIESLA